MNKTYPTLYAKSNADKVLIWYAEQHDNAYRTTSGQLDGKKVTTDWTLCQPKNIGRANETSGVEQAVLEIDALYKKRLKQKYKTDIKDIDTAAFFQPTLAKKYSDYALKINFFDGSWIAQNKFNGVRAVAKKDGIFSRTGERWLTVPHIEESLKEHFELFPNEVLDGELYNHDLRQNLNDLISIVRKSVNITPEILEKSEQIVRFYVYDHFEPTVSDSQYIHRKQVIDNYIIPTNSKYLRKVDDYEISNVEELDKLFDETIADGGEGLILRKKDSTYECKRSKNLLKLKTDDDDEGIILAIHDADGNWANKCKTFTIKWTDKKGVERIFDASLKGSMKDAIDVWNNRDKWIGKEVTFLYMGLTGLGNPNYARIDVNNCFKK
jgi:ATP-dependent DNA ligase